MSNFLVVPVHLDALVLASDRQMVEAMADFSRLPYLHGTREKATIREINGDKANISEEIVSQPFQSQNLSLKAGAHLHWSLPDALTKGIQHAEGSDFPAVPNRWLITRSLNGSESSRKSWVVESDYVFPLPDPNDKREYVLGAGPRSGAISYFYREWDPQSAEPFRYVGRQLPLEAWLGEPPQSESVSKTDNYFPGNKPLTALGYGEIAFAAFYPNCHSVFGFYDPEVTTTPNEYKYELIGWHSQETQDPVRRLLLGEAILNCFNVGRAGLQRRAAIRRKALLDQLKPFNENRLLEIIDGLIGGESLRSELRDFLSHQSLEFLSAGLQFFQQEAYKEFLGIKKLADFDWAVSEELKGDALPERALYYSSLTFVPEIVDAGSAEGTDKVEISIGNSTMEALSAYLARQIAPDFGIEIDPKTGPLTPAHAERLEKLEDQLESLYLMGKLANRTLDIGPKFREARHNSGFTPVSGGKRWAVRLQSTGAPGPVNAPAAGKNGSDADTSGSGEAANAQAQRRIILPPELTKQLSTLNRLQTDVDELQQRIETLRKQLFSDWYKYMLSAYHPEDTIRGDDYPDVDEAQFFIEEADIRPLEELIRLARRRESLLELAGSQLRESIRRHNHSLMVRFRPLETATSGPLGMPEGVEATDFESCLEHNLNFTDDPDAAGAGANPAFAKGLSFDGKTKYARVFWKEQPAPDRRGVTLSAWINPRPERRTRDSAAGFREVRTVFAIGDLVLELRPIVRGANHRLAVACPGIDERIGVISPGRWHHLAIAIENPEAPGMVFFINGQRFPLLPKKEASTRLKNFDPLFVGASNRNDDAGFLGKMTQVRVDNRALSAAEVRRDMNGGDRPVFELYAKAGPRYWQPSEPVILMVGEGICATDRHGKDGRLREDEALECPVIESVPSILDQLVVGKSKPTQPDLDKAIGEISKSARACVESAASAEIAQSKWSGQPWNPIMLEWETLLRPARGTADVEGAAFATDVIKSNYDLRDNAVDLTVKKDRAQLAPGTVYSNRCFLTPHGADQLRERIAEFLEKFLDDLETAVAEFERENDPGAVPSRRHRVARTIYLGALAVWFAKESRKKIYDEETPFVLSRDSLETLKTWYKEKPLFAETDTMFGDPENDQKADDPVYVIICAGLKLFDESGEPITFLSQSLGGFNDELLMHKHTLQLPVADPLGFDDYQAFTARVAKLIDGHVDCAPEPTNQFNPIRTGAMSVTRLRLIDTFGQVKDFNEEAILAAQKEIITPQRLTVPGTPHLSWFPPRLVQPARIDFHWLKADEKDPDSTPICGWVLPNNLQKTLEVYDRKGEALGAILQRGSKVEWEPAPGRNREADEIENSHFRKMLTHLLEKEDGDGVSTGRNFLEDFLTAIESALETIAPESHAQHRSLALLMGRPIAVVRASLDLQLRGPAAIHQGWHAFQEDLRRRTRETDDFEKVEFPIRIGEYQQLNDGVVGYWIEEGEGYHDNTFYAPQTPENAANKTIDHSHIDLHTEDEPVHIFQTIDSPPLTATLLFDPRGKIHLTSGLVPTKVLDIPAEEYAAAMEAIEVTFLTAPILSQRGTRSVAVPSEPGFDWTWREHERWLEKTVLAEALAGDSIAAEPEDIWNHLKGSGWIQEADERSDRARIVPMGRRASEKLPESLPGRAKIEDRLEHLFWSEYFSEPILERDTFLDRLTALSAVANKALCQSVWEHLRKPEIQWLVAIPGDSRRARVVPIDQRHETALSPPPEWTEALKTTGPVLQDNEATALTAAWVERILNTEALELSPVETQAGFETENEIREGWLVLKKHREREETSA